MNKPNKNNSNYLVMTYLKKMTPSQRLETLDFMGYLLTKDIRNNQDLEYKTRAQLAQEALALMRKIRGNTLLENVSPKVIQKEIDTYRAEK